MREHRFSPFGHGRWLFVDARDRVPSGICAIGDCASGLECYCGDAATVDAGAPDAG